MNLYYVKLRFGNECFGLFPGLYSNIPPTIQPVNVKLITLITADGSSFFPSIRKPTVNSMVIMTVPVSRAV